jgi:hypothetical protein
MLGTFHTIWIFDVSDAASWKLEAKQAMNVLQERPGFVSASIFHNADSPERYLIKTDWLGRRFLSPSTWLNGSKSWSLAVLGKHAG